MTYFGEILYFLLFALLLLFWRKRSGLSLDGLLERSERDHHHVHRVATNHPHGGTWTEHKQWMKGKESEPE